MTPETLYASGGGTYLAGELVNELMTDVVVDNFRQRIARGEIIMNPMYKSVNTLKTPGVGYVSYRTEQANCANPADNPQYYETTGVSHRQ